MSTDPKPQKRNGSRTGYDEYHYDEQLRAEVDAIRVVAKHRGDALKAEREQHAYTITMLINTTAMLMEFLTQAQVRWQNYLNTLNSPMRHDDCSPGCKEHYWSDADGWHKRNSTD